MTGKRRRRHREGWLWRLLARFSRPKAKPGRPFARYEPLFAGRGGLEIGGPSGVFRKTIGIYQRASMVDGVNFSDRTIWEGEIAAGRTYRLGKNKLGWQYIAEASDLSGVPAQRYDFLVSSNCLEHVANPLKALEAWREVLVPGGTMVLVVPRRDSTFDHRRPYTTFAHLKADHAADVGEDDMTHLEEILACHDLSRDPRAGDAEAFRRRGLDNLANRCLHHHVFSRAVLAEAMGFAGLSVIELAETEGDLWCFARKPAG